MRFPDPAKPSALARKFFLALLPLACGVQAASTGVPTAPSPGIVELGKQDYYWIPAVVVTAIPAQIRYSDMPITDTAALDKGHDLWAFDRWAAGMYSSKYALASDAFLVPLLALPIAATAWDSRQGRQTWGAAVSEGVVYGEALALSSSLDLLVRSMRLHPRPLVYNTDAPDKERLTGEASGSFYSGHANAAFLSAVYFSYTYSLRHPDSPAQGWIWAGSLAAASLEAGLRVAAGKHYLSDVAVGAAVGSLFGWGLPYLHRRGPGTDRLGLAVGIGRDGAYPVLTLKF